MGVTRTTRNRFIHRVSPSPDMEDFADTWDVPEHWLVVEDPLPMCVLYRYDDQDDHDYDD